MAVGSLVWQKPDEEEPLDGDDEAENKRLEDLEGNYDTKNDVLKSHPTQHFNLVLVPFQEENSKMRDESVSNEFH